jgi:hypothetical protein
MSLFINIFFPVLIFLLLAATFGAWRRDLRTKDYELNRKMNIFFPRDRFSFYKISVTVALVVAIVVYILFLLAE